MSQQASTMPAHETHAFQAEIKQLLDIVVHSLYTHRDVFVRELISNAADALERFRHESLVNPAIPDRERALEVRIELDEDAKTFQITDSGDGMTHDELVQNLGTIARSGTRDFVARLAEGARHDVNLIGQFGVGFYSAFMVAKKVTVQTRSCHSDSPGWEWESDGVGAYSMMPKEGLEYGTRILIQLRDDADEFAKDWKIREVVRKFSSFVTFPILLRGEKLNTVQAIWTRNKNEVKDEEYAEFFKFVSNMTDDPTYRLHFSADAPLMIHALLFVPEDNFERIGFGRMKAGVDLYCRKILIMKHPEELLPDWMRFVRGVVDSEDLPLNISREMLQDNRLIRKLAQVITGRFIKHLEEESRTNPDKYNEFYKKFGLFLKEGVTQDFPHRNDLARLLRFESSLTEPGKTTSLTDYISRMKDGQGSVYYINGPSREAIEAGPYVEVFKERGIEILYTHEPLDDFVMSHLGEFDGKALVSADQDDLKLPDSDAQREGEELPMDEVNALCGWMKTTLGNRIHEVKSSKRLVGSPVVAVTSGAMTSAMRRILMSVNKDQTTAENFMSLEVNPRHPLIRRLNTLRTENEDFARDVAEQLCDNALFAAGLLLDPRNMVERMNRFLGRAVGI